MPTEYTEGVWAGLPRFECAACGWSTAHRDRERAESTMRRHIRRSHRARPAPAEKPAEAEEMEDLGEINFASDNAAEAFLALGEDHRAATALRLLDREPSGKTGHTVADVRAAAAEANNNEE